MVKRVSVMLGPYLAPKIGKIGVRCIGVLLAVMLLAHVRRKNVHLNQFGGNWPYKRYF